MIDYEHFGAWVQDYEEYEACGLAEPEKMVLVKARREQEVELERVFLL